MVEPDGGVEGFIIGDTKGKHPSACSPTSTSTRTRTGTEITGEFGTDSQEQGPYAPSEEQDPAVLTNGCLGKDHGHGHGHGRK